MNRSDTHDLVLIVKNKYRLTATHQREVQLYNHKTFMPKSFKKLTAAKIPMLEKKPSATAMKKKSKNPLIRALMSLDIGLFIESCWKIYDLLI